MKQITMIMLNVLPRRQHLAHDLWTSLKRTKYGQYFSIKSFSRLQSLAALNDFAWLHL